jgi:hypothetical protein
MVTFYQILIFASISVISLKSFAFITQETMIRLRATDPTSVTEISTQIKQEVMPNIDADIKVTSPLQIEVKGHLPVILVPVAEGITEVKVNSPSYKEAIQSYGQREMSEQLSLLMMEVQTIQKNLQKRELDKALARITQLQGSYPELPFLDFIRGSVLFLQGKKNDARDAVKKAMEAHPDYEEGKNFLRNLGEDVKSGSKSE